PEGGPVRARAPAGRLVPGGLLPPAPGPADLPRPSHPLTEDEPEQAPHSRLRGAGGLRHRHARAARSLAVGHRAAGRDAARAEGSAALAGRCALPRRTGRAQRRPDRGGAHRDLARRSPEARAGAVAPGACRRAGVRASAIQSAGRGGGREARRPGVSDVHERLRRLLFVVPYVARHRGVSVDALAKQLGVSREELLRDLELLTMVGRPPFQPDDFIDLHVENDQVWVDLDQRFSKPPRLTGPEAAALAAAAELLRPAAQSALASALAKLEKILPAQAKKMYRELGSAVNARSLASAELGILTRAVEERRELEFDYAGQGSTATERRRVEPVEVFNHRGQWYLYGWDLGR